MFVNEEESEDGAIKHDMDEAVVTHELGVSLRSEPISEKLVLLLVKAKLLAFKKILFDAS